MADCFISYRRTPSAPVATALQSKLESKYGIDAYVDTTRTDGTRVRFPERLMTAIADAPVFICLLGERDGQHTLESEWVLKEIQQAYDLRKFCIPVFQESYRPLPNMSAAVDYLLGFDGVHILDQKNIMIDESVRQLADLIRPHRKKRILPFLVAGLVMLILLTLGVILVLSNRDGNVDNSATPNPTSAVAQAATDILADAFTPTLSGFQQLQTTEAELTQAAGTQAALALTSTELFISNSNATSTAWQFAITETAAYATLLALSATPTETPRPTDTPDPLQAALTPVTSNADWTPVERDFDGVTMVLVPAGSFEMGSTPEEIDSGFEMCQQAADNNAECQRRWFEDEAQNGDNTQTFNEPFWIDRTEVTRAQYQVCIDAGICEKTPDSDFSTENDQPINRVTWFQAQTYCEWREARLPTEAEWEYAARGPERFIFPWGNEFDGSRANHCDSNCGDADWASSYNYVNEENDDGFAMTSPVASYPEGASWVGATDMAGNVWEWTSSLYEDYPYDEADGRERDTGDSTDVLRVLRGGSFINATYNLRSANRNRLSPGYVISSYGFRCARS